MAEDQYYLTVSKKKIKTGKGQRGKLALITLGSKQLGDKQVIVCSVNVVKNEEEAARWYEEQMETREWEKETQVFERIPGLFATSQVGDEVAQLLTDDSKKKVLH